MRAVWTHAGMLLAGALIALASGLWMMQTSRSQARTPQEIVGTQKVLEEMGGESGLRARRRSLVEAQQRLKLELAAKSGDAETFNRRLEEVFSELGLAISSSSPWQAVPEATGFAAFERTFTGNGAFEALLDAVHTIESWPDQVRIRALTTAFEAPRRVAFTLEINAVRIAPQEAS